MSCHVSPWQSAVHSVVLLLVQLKEHVYLQSLRLLRRTGKATYENGAVYEGDFERDHRWGWGLQRFPDCSAYEGEWYDDLIEGGAAASEQHRHSHFLLPRVRNTAP